MNVTCTELEKVTDSQWLRFGTTRTENVNRVMKEIPRRKPLETEQILMQRVQTAATKLVPF